MLSLLNISSSNYTHSLAVLWTYCDIFLKDSQAIIFPHQPHILSLTFPVFSQPNVPRSTQLW